MVPKYDDEALKKYLLGKSNAEERVQLERNLILDRTCFEQLMVVRDELFDSYLEGELSPEDGQAFELVILSTPEGPADLMMAKGLREIAVKGQSEPVKQKTISIETIPSDPYVNPVMWKIAAGLGLVLLTILAIIGWRGRFYRPELRKGFEAFKKTYRSQRPLDARLSVLAYAPVRSTRGDDRGNIDEELRMQAESFFHQAVSEYPGAESHNALGLSLLADKKIEKAVEYLKKAVAENPNNARFESDLGAALLEEGKADKATENIGRSEAEFGESLEHITIAIKLDPNLLDSLFNKGLLVEEMSLPGKQKIQTWRDYLNKDSSSPWAEEARQRISAVERQEQKSSRDTNQLRLSFLTAYESRDAASAWDIYRQSFDSLGSSITNSLIETYLDEKSRGNEVEAEHQIEMLSFIADLESKRAQDSYTSRLVEFYSESTPEKRSVSLQARNLMRLGYDLVSKSENVQAIKSFDQASEMFEEIGDEPENLLAHCCLAHCDAGYNDNKTSLRMLSSILAESRRAKYGWIEEQCLFVLAYANMFQRNYDTAVSYTKTNIEISEQSGNIDGLLNGLIQLADEERSLNNGTRASALLRRSLDLVGKYHVEPSQTWGIYTSLGLSLGSMNLNYASVEYHTAALEIANKMGHPHYVSLSYEYLGLTLDKLGQFGEGVKDVGLAYSTAQSIKNEPERNGVMAHSLLQLGDIYYRNRQYNRALENYDEGLKLYDRLSVQSKIYDAAKGKFLSYLGLGNDMATEDEIHEVMALLEEYRSRILKEKQRYTFFAKEQSICDLVVKVEDKKNNKEAAFNYSEMCRARSLLDVAENGASIKQEAKSLDLDLVSSARALTLTEIEDQMPDDSQILVFKMLDDRLLIWLLLKAGKDSRLREVPISSADLTKKINDFLEKISTTVGAENEDVDGLKHSARELYDILIQPQASSINSNKRLCIVPDKTLFYLPFAALITQSNKYFGAEHSSVSAASASMFIKCFNNARGKGIMADEHLLSVGNPVIDRTVFKKLIDLPDAVKEAHDVGAFYKEPTILTGAQAKPTRVKTEMRNSDVIHLAVHNLSDVNDPLRTKMVFSKDGTGDGSIQAYEIYELDLSRVRLVVLSACETGTEHYYEGEGPVSIASPFIAKGVPLVAASLWLVDSIATARLMSDFHRFRRAGGQTSADALQSAQKEMMTSSITRYQLPYYWAAFVVVGGQTDY